MFNLVGPYSLHGAPVSTPWPEFLPSFFSTALPLPCLLSHGFGFGESALLAVLAIVVSYSAIAVYSFDLAHANTTTAPLLGSHSTQARESHTTNTPANRPGHGPGGGAAVMRRGRTEEEMPDEG